MSSDSESAQLAAFCADLTFDKIPPEVVDAMLDLMADWAGSCLAGSNSRLATIFRNFSRDMGPDSGLSTIIGSTLTTSPVFAAMVNAAASHVVEQDDLHNSSIFHPATVVFPPLFAAAQALPVVTGKAFITAAVAGYEAGIRVGEFLGLAHYRVFHTTGTAGTIAAAMAVANLLRLDQETTLDSLGSAGTQAAGLWAFLGDAADSKQLHTAKAAADGLLSAWTAKAGLTGAKRILEDEQGMGAGMLASGERAALVAGLGQRWALTETSFKWHASCRHTHPAADAMQEIMETHNPDVENMAAVNVGVYQAAYDVLGAVKIPRSIHQSKFSMGFVLALVAIEKRAGVQQFTKASIEDPALLALLDKVEMAVQQDIDDVYPQKWCARVRVTMRDGSAFESFVDTPRGDPGNPLTRQEIAQKAQSLVAYYDTCDSSRMQKLLDDIWSLKDSESVNGLFEHCLAANAV